MQGQTAGLLRVLVAAVMALGLLVPVTDHHFAERVPGHQHLAVESGPVVVVAAHHHPFETPHQHLAPGESVVVARSTGFVAAVTVVPQAPPGFAEGREALTAAANAPLLLPPHDYRSHTSDVPLVIPTGISHAPPAPPPLSTT